jgi:hypothetical protein
MARQIIGQVVCRINALQNVTRKAAGFGIS